MGVILTLSARAQQRAASNMNSSRLLDIACVLSAGKNGKKKKKHITGRTNTTKNTQSYVSLDRGTQSPALHLESNHMS